jgi:periplasmic protein TonB
MRRLFFNFFVSVLTFGIGMGANALQSALTWPGLRTNREAVSTLKVACPSAPAPNLEKPSISGGLLNNKAIRLPQPDYPPVAKAARQSGTVTVQVVVDENGQVVSARAVAGPPLLQAAAVRAAYEATFSPTMLSGRPVKVTGAVTYNFILQ